MNIAYAVRSKFTAPCQESITDQQEALNTRQLIAVALEPGGYAAKVIVTVHASSSTEFETDWSAGDPTRFPVRIKAAATALRNSGNFGRFEISHSNGLLSISKQ